jgi:hypothetical protein
MLANEDPTDRDRRDRRLIPKSCACRDFHLSRCSPIPGHRVLVPLRRGIVEALSKLWLSFAFERRSASFSCFTHRGRIIQTGIHAHSRDDAHLRQTTHLQQEIQHHIRPISGPHKLACVTQQRRYLEEAVSRSPCHIWRAL